MIALFVILLLLWLLRIITNNTFDGLIHLLLVVGLVGLALIVFRSDGRGRRRANLNINKNLGMLFIGTWFILTGLFSLIGFSFEGQNVIMGLLALLGGIMLVFGR